MTARMIISFSCVRLTHQTQEGRKRREGYIWIIFNTAAAEQTKQRRRRVMHTSEIVMIQTDTQTSFLLHLLSYYTTSTGASHRRRGAGYTYRMGSRGLSFIWFGVQGGTGTQTSREERHGGETKMSIK